MMLLIAVDHTFKGYSYIVDVCLSYIGYSGTSLAYGVVTVVCK